jgi:hypothetical protein
MTMPKYCIAAGVLLTLATSASALEIEIDHQTGTQSLRGSNELARGDPVTIWVRNTDKQCFTYNATQVAASGTKSLENPDTTVKIVTTHQRGTSAYLVKIDKLPGDACKEVDQRAGSWTIPVVTVGWDLAFSAGPVVDNLVDKKYFLQSGVGGQYTVSRDRGAEDKTNQRLAVFAHLVDTKALRDKDYTWIPLSFGIGFDDKARYMLGTSYKIGDQWFITAGVVTGKVSTLPTGVSEGMSTTNQNLLATQGQKTSTGVFISVSFTFLQDRSKSSFEGLFPAPKPTP